MAMISEQFNKNKNYAPIRNAIKEFFIAIEYYFSNAQKYENFLGIYLSQDTYYKIIELINSKK